MSDKTPVPVPGHRRDHRQGTPFTLGRTRVDKVSSSVTRDGPDRAGDPVSRHRKSLCPYPEPEP